MKIKNIAGIGVPFVNPPLTLSAKTAVSDGKSISAVLVKKKQITAAKMRYKMNLKKFM
jgi:hypothetical protein